MQIKIKGKDNTEATLSKEQFDLVEPIIVKMMNGEIKLRHAEYQLENELEAAGLPLIFLPVEPTK